MGTKDKTTRRLEECNDVFADIINVLVFDGKQIVKAHELEDADTKSEIAADDKGLHGQERDVAKFWTAQNIRIALFGLENQSTPDSQMPLRLYSYNGASYKAQIIPNKQSDTDKQEANPETTQDSASAKQPLYPVLTLVLYFGLERWNKAKSLYESIHIPDNLKRFIPDFPINLIEIAWLEDTVIDKFQSDFKIVAHFFQQLRIHGKASTKMQNPILMNRIDHLLELMRMFSAYTGDPQYENYGIHHLHSKEVTMLAVLKEAYDDEREEGRKEGREEGRKEGRKEGKEEERNGLNLIYSTLFKQGRAEDVQRAVNDPEYLKRIMDEFGIKDDEEDATQNSRKSIDENAEPHSDEPH